ncbi:DNA methyltransferase [Thermogutta sp.]|uniref:Eco57I restriction-modification methylase domain-containing protein n=1 Tax=Thermogutta sp. TaxID=1962930 RepID=UPI0032205AB6
MPRGGSVSDSGRPSAHREATEQLGTQPPTEKELAIAWESTPFAIRYSLFAAHALLSIRVLDPACGSGHFLLAAARRLGKELARVRTGEEEPSPEAQREATRDVIAHSIYGVDKNPLAVELCKVALWIESHVSGKPLTFLDHRIRCGDSLVGVLELDVLKGGIPDEAFDPVSRDAKEDAALLKKRNRNERRDLESGQLLLPLAPARVVDALGARHHDIEAIADDSPAAVLEKKSRYDRLLADPDRLRIAEACDLWTAAFFQRIGNSEQERRANSEVANRETDEPFAIRHSPFADPIRHSPFADPIRHSPFAPITTDTLRRYLESGTAHPQALAAARALAEHHHFFHWPLEFPEVFASGGFHVIIGNPPFMGGLKISGALGEKYRHWLEVAYAPYGGTADLCAAFYRRVFSLLKPGGRMGMVATNTIGQGDTRESGLAILLRQGGVITFAKRFIKWPDAANVEVNLVAIHKPHHSPFAIRHSPILDGQPVPFISSRLDAEPEAEPQRLPQNEGKAFIGDYVRGIGFVLEPEEAEALLAKDPRNADCLFPYLNGEDLNSHPEQKPSRWVICFHDWDLERAKQYPDLLRIVEERVRPERERLRGPGDKRNREYWWQFGAYRAGMRRAIAPLRRVLVRSRVSELHAMAFVPLGWIYNEQLVVFAFDDDYHFALLQSSVHEVWVWRQASSLESRNRYTPTDCFDTFPFPPVGADLVSALSRAASGEQRAVGAQRAVPWRMEEMPEAFQRAARIGAEYHEHRRQIMLSRNLGLTKTYNLFHNPTCTDGDIVRLRELHAEMDRAILACYAWTDVQLRHDFYQNDRGQTRYTVSPEARRELLRRLVELSTGLISRG